MRLYRAEGSHDEPGYAGTVDVRTGRFFGSLERALTYCMDGRHLYRLDLTEVEWMMLGGSPDDHVLVTAEQAARKVHSDLCPCRK